MSEEAMRELANQHRGEVVAGSGTPVEGRRLGQMVSLRLEPDVVADLRDIANERGQTISDLLREGAARVIAADRFAATAVELASVEVTVVPIRAYASPLSYQTGNPVYESADMPTSAATGSGASWSRVA